VAVGQSHKSKRSRPSMIVSICYPILTAGMEKTIAGCAERKNHGPVGHHLPGDGMVMTILL